MSRVIKLQSNKVVINQFFDRISKGLEGVAAEMLAVGRLVAQAEQELEPLDLIKLKTELASRGKMSAPTWSKFKAIGQKDVLHTKKIAKLMPGSWTTIYEITVLSDADIRKAVEKEQIHPKIERSTVKSLRSGVSTRKGPGKRSDVFRLGEILVPKDLEADSVHEFTHALNELTAQYGIQISIAEKQRKQYVLKETGDELRRQFKKELAGMCRKNLSQEKLKLYESTMFQLQTYWQGGAYPYDKADPVSVENPKHPFVDYDHSSFIEKLLEEKVITQHTDVTSFSGKLKCLTLGLLYCTSDNRRQQRNHWKKLNDTVRAGKKNAKLAKKIIEQIGEVTT